MHKFKLQLIIIRLQLLVDPCPPSKSRAHGNFIVLCYFFTRDKEP